MLIIGIIVTLSLTGLNAAQAAAQARITAGADAGRQAERVAAVLEPMDDFANALRALVVTHHHESDSQQLQDFMNGLYSQWGGLRSVAVAPGNRVSAIAPVEGNESVLGLYYPDNADQWPAVRDAIAKGQPVLIGPVDLVQGGQGFIYRMPVFLQDGSYWGMVSAVSDFESVAGAEYVQTGLAIRQHDDPATMVLGDSSVFEHESALSRVTSLGANWDVAVAVIPDTGSAMKAIMAVGFLTSIALAGLVFLLTGALSREHDLAQLMNDLSEQAPGVLFQLRQRVDGTRVMSYASSGVRALLRGQSGESTAGMATLEDLVHPDDRLAVHEALDESARSSLPWHQRFRVRLPSQPVTWLLADARPRIEPGGEVVWHGWVGDITEDRRDEEALRVSASLFEVTRDGVAILDSAGIVTSVNPGLQVISGYPSQELVGSPFATHWGDLTANEVLDDMWQHLERHGYWRGEVTCRRKDGAARTDSAVASAVRDPEGRLSHYVVVLENSNLTRDDPVTGLPNVRLLDETVRLALMDASGTGASTALVVIGLDHFRRVNDVYGHRVGDDLLRAVAQRISDQLPSASTFARLRGDEFSFAVPYARDLAEVESLATAALASVSMPFLIDGRTLHTTATAGISLSPEDAADVPDLHLHANQAMRAAKSLGPNQQLFFIPEMQAALQERARLADDLESALSSAQLALVYQPIIDLRTGAIHRAEALMRWSHPVLGSIAPDRFIPLAEQNGLICDIGNLAFAHTIDALLRLRAVDPDFQISVNLSPIELHEADGIHPRRVSTIAASGLPGSSIIIEITEGALLSHDPIVDANLAAYRSAGLRYAIDDFGTGYSSLSYLQQLDVHFLKIDRSFVDAILPGSDGLALCQAIIEMAHKLKIQVIAEGVETTQQNLLLTEAGCDYAQGYLHARPMPLDQLVQMITPMSG